MVEVHPEPERGEQQPGGGWDPALGPHPLFPQDPEFYRRVLEELPTPVVVVNEQADFIYANRACREVGRYDVEDGLRINALDTVHPDDAAWAAEVFLSAVGSETSDHQLDGTHWGTIEFRIVSTDGRSIPLEVTGNSGLADPHVGGIVYDIRPSFGMAFMDRIVAALARGEPTADVLLLICQMIARPPAGLEAAIVDVSDPRSHEVLAVSDDEVGWALEASTPGQVPWLTSGPDPAHSPVDRVPGEVGLALAGAGFTEAWHLAIDPVPGHEAVRLVVVAQADRYGNTARQRLRRASNLTSLTLWRAHHDSALAHDASHDHLTGLANRAGFRAGLGSLLAERSGTGVLLIDLDGFKPVNDTYGHAVGDEVLEIVARRLGKVTRPDDLVARVGGDEFAIATRADTPGALAALRERVEQTLRRPMKVDAVEATIRISGSIGAALGERGADLDRLIETADLAMYAAKRGEEAYGVRLLGS